jgi:hypothetical protein
MNGGDPEDATGHAESSRLAAGRSRRSRAPTDMSIARGTIDRLRLWSFSHPRARWVLREGWGLSHRTARRLHLPAPFDPPEFGDLRRVSTTTPQHEDAVRVGAHPRLLFLSLRGWSTHLLWETTLAQAARLRGAEPVFATCGGRLPICDAANLHSAPPMPCVSCAEYATEGIRLAGFAPTTLRDLVDVRAEIAAARRRIEPLTTVAACQAFVDGTLPLGRLVRISVAWFLARGTLPETELVLKTYRRFLTSGQVLHRAFIRLLERVVPDRVVMLNGTFFAESILAELARQRGIPLTTYERGFAADSIVVTPARAAAELMIDAQFWAEAALRPLSELEARRLDEVLDTRTRGERLPDNFWKGRIEDVASIRGELRLAPERPLVLLFSNILWDSAVQEKDIAFESMAAWVVESIAGFAARPGVDLVVRLHPAEVRLANHRTEERMADVISSRFPVLPPNVRVIAPESPISSYALMSMASLGLVYTSTVGLEMAVRGIPVVVAADTHYRGRGFTEDIADRRSFWRVVDDLCATADPSASRRELARRYAALFFLRFMQPLELIQEASRGRPRLAYASLDELAVGNSSTLDRITAGIVEGVPVVTPVEDLC